MRVGAFALRCSYGNAPSADGAPVAEGVLDDLVCSGARMRAARCRGAERLRSQLQLTPRRRVAAHLSALFQVGRPLFLALYDYFKAQGGIYKLAFGTRPSCAMRAPALVRSADVALRSAQARRRS
jgi:hypothetical protein